MRKKNTIIFDFDGTIADTMPFILAVINQLAVNNNFQKISKEEFKTIRNKSLLAIIKEYKISPFKIPFLVIEGQKMLKEKMGQVQFVGGMREVLLELKNRGYKLGILSSNSLENIKLFLEKNKSNVFDFVHSEKNLFGKDKSLKNILKQYNLKKDEVVYIGDEVRDIEACQKVGIKIIAVTWGFNTREILLKSNPDAIVDDPKKLATLFLP